MTVENFDAVLNTLLNRRPFQIFTALAGDTDFAASVATPHTRRHAPHAPPALPRSAMAASTG